MTDKPTTLTLEPVQSAVVFNDKGIVRGYLGIPEDADTDAVVGEHVVYAAMVMSLFSDSPEMESLRARLREVFMERASDAEDELDREAIAETADDEGVPFDKATD